MSTEIETRIDNLAIRQFWGGDERGMCLQLTPLQEQEPYIHLSLKDAVELRCILSKFISDTAKRRQEYLQQQIKELKLAERSVLNEVAELNPDFYNVSDASVGFILQFTPAHPSRAAMMASSEKEQVK